jgi:flavin reductase (DIM6/NTAB) family NADH-FMN oxidoreductase RutF
VNLLSIEDREIANRFASPIPPEERFGGGMWGTLATGSPVLESAVTVFDCSVRQVVEVATHSILVGAIQAIRFREPHVRPLLHAHAAFATVAPVGVPGPRSGEQIHSELQFLEDCLHWGLM